MLHNRLDQVIKIQCIKCHFKQDQISVDYSLINHNYNLNPKKKNILLRRIWVPASLNRSLFCWTDFKKNDMTYSEIYHISHNYKLMREFPEQLLEYWGHESTYVPSNTSTCIVIIYLMEFMIKKIRNTMSWTA